MTAPTLHVADGIELPIDFVTSSNGILAKKGAGKTSAAIVLLEEMYAAGVPVVSIDPKGDHYGIRTSADGERAGLPIPVFGGRHGDIPLEPTAGAVVADLVIDQELSCVLDVSEFTRVELRRFLSAFGDRLYRRADRTPMHLFLEECHEYLPQQVRGDDADLVNTWTRIVKQGRFKGIGVTALSQRSASVSKEIISQIDNLFVLRTTAPQDRDAVKGWIDTHADSRAILSELPSLQNGECWLWQPEQGDPVKFTFRLRRTFDAGATPKVGETRRAPKTIADVNLDAIAAAMAETIERVKSEDPAHLQRENAELRRKLTAAENRPPTIVEKVVEKPVPAPAPPSTAIDPEAEQRLRKAAARARDVLVEFERALAALSSPAAPAPAPSSEPVVRAPRPKSAPAPAPADAAPDVQLRSGARRMVEALGRMAPLRLTKSQWGTVAHLKTSGGTWSTYLSDIRRAGLVDENHVGYTLTDAGFDYLGGRPAPMTPEELQGHYRSILRAGAVKMLDALIDAHPRALSKAELGQAADIAITGGTFSTYLSDLVRNGLAERHDGDIVATDVLMFGARA
jgi:hypothetical protein